MISLLIKFRVYEIVYNIKRRINSYLVESSGQSRQCNVIWNIKYVVWNSNIVFLDFGFIIVYGCIFLKGTLKR